MFQLESLKRGDIRLKKKEFRENAAQIRGCPLDSVQFAADLPLWIFLQKSCGFSAAFLTFLNILTFSYRGLHYIVYFCLHDHDVKKAIKKKLNIQALEWFSTERHVQVGACPRLLPPESFYNRNNHINVTFSFLVQNIMQECIR